MAEIPSPNKVVGDPGHTEDHNNIVTVLVDHQDRIVNAEGTLAKALTTDGGVDIDLDNTTKTRFTYINLPAGDRADQQDVFGVYRSGSRVTALDGNGYLRSKSSAPGDIPHQTQAHANQSADLHQWIDAAGNVLARIDSKGRFVGGNVTPTAPTDLTLAGGLQWDSTAGNRPQYWQLMGNYVEIRGSVKKSDNTPFNFSGGSILLGTLPPELGAPGGYRTIQPTQQTNESYLCQVVVSPDGTIRAQGSADHRPTWITLDNIRFMRTTS